MEKKIKTPMQRHIEWLQIRVDSYSGTEKGIAYKDALDDAIKLLNDEKQIIIDSDLAGVKRMVVMLYEKGYPMEDALKLIDSIEKGNDTHEEGIERYEKAYSHN